MKRLTYKRRAARLVIVACVLALGAWLRTLQPFDNLAAAVPWPWATATLTIYHAEGAYLFPLSRTVSADTDLPRAAMGELLAGPPPGTGLTSALPPGLALRTIRVADGVAQVALAGSADALREAPLGVAAIVATLTRVTGITRVALTVGTVALTDAAQTMPLLYYPSARGLVAVRTTASDPRAALDAFLAGREPAPLGEGDFATATSPELTRLPADVRLLGTTFDEKDGLFALRFAYTSSVRELALERPGQMRLLLLGLIATLTGYPAVRAVQLDFGGQSRLGLGECSDLLRTPQPRPALLNDERLLR